MSGIARAVILVSGVVQGVFYRSTTAETALSLGLTGSAKNLADGRVRVVVEGEKDKIEELIKWCRSGPPSAKVSLVEVEWEEPAGEFATFSVEL